MEKLKRPSLCTHSYPSPSPSFALPLYSLTFSLCGSSGQSYKTSLYFLPEVAAEAAPSPGAPECLCSSHMVSSRLEVSVLALAHTNLCIMHGLFVTPPSPLHMWQQAPFHGQGRVKGHVFRGKLSQPCRGRSSSPSPVYDRVTCMCKTLSITGLACLFSPPLVFISRKSRLFHSM